MLIIRLIYFIFNMYCYLLCTYLSISSLDLKVILQPDYVRLALGPRAPPRRGPGERDAAPVGGPRLIFTTTYTTKYHKQNMYNYLIL